MPPAFYEDDMLKWQNKFKTAREERLIEKNRMKARGYLQPQGTKNQNISTPRQLQRSNSRQSTAAFNAIDFEYTGNTN